MGARDALAEATKDELGAAHQFWAGGFDENAAGMSAAAVAAEIGSSFQTRHV